MFKWAALVFAIVFFLFLATGYPVTPYLKNRTGNYYAAKVRFGVFVVLGVVILFANTCVVRAEHDIFYDFGCAL